ncbi:bifunctional DNA primase/polymerase [Streptomyces sp. B21-083]|uniref:bifunctional DNA primase/polymerase n=1 Tax=Streptomyces sp. B21-083 TaxID=3039410 RepID=UPI002FF3955C
MNNPLLNAALAAAERGWYVFPLRPGTKYPGLHGAERCRQTGDCTHGHLKWEQRASIDPHRIRHCWETSAGNIALATGPSGLVVVDLDMPKPEDDKGTPDGETSFQALCERAGHPVPDTYRVRTPSGGMHLYFTTPPGIQLPSTKGTLAPKIDTRAWGGYVVAAGSRTPTGPYEAASGSVVAPVPGWLLSILKPAPKPSQTPSGPVTVQSGRYADMALGKETRNVAGAQPGEREATLFRAARALGRFVAWGDLPRSMVEQALQEAGERAGLTAAECRSTLRSALNWSIAHNQRRRDAA